MLDQSLTTLDVVERQHAIIGQAKMVTSGMPRRCTHGVTTNQRCDDCHRQHLRWYQMEIPDRTTTMLVRYVKTDTGIEGHMTQPGRAATAWFPGYLEIVDFRPIWATWRSMTAQAIQTQDKDHGMARGVTIDTFEDDDLMEMWARDTLPHKAAMELLARLDA